MDFLNGKTDYMTRREKTTPVWIFYLNENENIFQTDILQKNEIHENSILLLFYKCSRNEELKANIQCNFWDDWVYFSTEYPRIPYCLYIQK